jgi:hypothetical protein
VIWRLDQLLRQAGRVDLAPLGAGVAAPVLAAVSAATVGAVLASRRPRPPVGWLLLALALSLSASGIASAYADYGLLARPGALPAARSVALYLPVPTVAALACLGFVLLLTPTGSLPSPRWRWWARVTAAAPVAVLLAIALSPGAADRPYQGAENPLDVRGLGGALLVVAASAVGASPVLLAWVVGCDLAVMPLAIGAAILRYRLYDLDRIISRVLGYGLLTVLLGGGYAVVVLGLGQLVAQDSSLVVAGATLAVAALFQPLRRRLQHAIDRRFNRRRHDAAATIAAFGGRLHQQVDLEALRADLLAVVHQTMQPTQASLWLRPGD